jgi:hypothetical protein
MATDVIVLNGGSSSGKSSIAPCGWSGSGMRVPQRVPGRGVAGRPGSVVLRPRSGRGLREEPHFIEQYEDGK